MSPANVYAIVSPAILALVLIEYLYCLWQRNGYYAFDDSIANFATAIGHQCTNVLVAFLMFLGFESIQSGYGLFSIEPTPLAWLGLYLGVDFLFYWFHRAGHSLNVLWAAHAPHHSSEELNYTVAIRASLTQRAASFFFYWPLALLGFPATMIIPAVAIHLVVQFLPHTRAVKRLPAWFESFVNCPTHHRVHHAINPQYLNKNMAGTFIVWDKLFGTYEPEREPCAYGVVPALRTWDPILANLQYWRPLVGDALATRSLGDKLRIWFMPIGWRPRDLPERAAEPAVHAVTQVKFKTPVSVALKAYLLAQLPLALVMMLSVSRSDSPLSALEKTLLTVLIWVAMVSWGGLLESRPWAYRLELPKLAVLFSAATWIYAGSPASVLGAAIGLTGIAMALALVVVVRPETSRLATR